MDHADREGTSRDWSDPNWKSMRALRGGITDAAREERKILFGENIIEIEARSLFQLLIDEVSTGPVLTGFTC